MSELDARSSAIAILSWVVTGFTQPLFVKSGRNLEQLHPAKVLRLMTTAVAVSFVAMFALVMVVKFLPAFCFLLWVWLWQPQIHLREDDRRAYSHFARG